MRFGAWPLRLRTASNRRRLSAPPPQRRSLFVRIGINAIALLSSLTGVGQYTRSLIGELAQHPDLDLHFFYARSWSKKLRSSPLRNIDAWKRMVKKYVPRPYIVSRAAQQIVFSAGANWRNLDLYHDPNFLAYRFDGPTVVTVHDLSWIRYPETHPPERVSALNELFPKSLTAADHIITDAHFVREELIRTFGVRRERITAIPLGARAAFSPRDEAQCQSTLRKHGLSWRSYLLSVGTLEPRKNLELVLRAYARLPMSVQERFPLAIVGMRGWLTSALESLIDPLARAGRVRAIGYVDDTELADLYACGKMLIYPSLYEGFGLPPLESMASGTPVIVSNASTLPEVVGDAGLMVDSCDVEGLQRSILQLIEDDDTWNALRVAGIERARTFSWRRCADETVAVYRKVHAESA